MEAIFFLVVFGALGWACWHWFLARWFEKTGIQGYLKGRQAANLVSDETYYEQAAAEIRRGSLRDGLWAQALAETMGNEVKARALYIKLRVAAMKDEVARNSSGNNHSQGNTVINCSRCYGALRVPLEKLLDVRCPKCGHEFRADTRGGVKAEEYADYTKYIVGRISRKIFLLHWLILIVLGIGLKIIFDQRVGEPLVLMEWLVLLAFLAYYFAVFIARLRDAERSSWLALLGAIPFVNLALVFYLSAIPGSAGRNRYGPPNTGLGFNTLFG